MTKEKVEVSLDENAYIIGLMVLFPDVTEGNYTDEQVKEFFDRFKKAVENNAPEQIPVD